MLSFLKKIILPPPKIQRSDEEQNIVNAACLKLFLYQTQNCPYCIAVRKELKALRLNIEQRDIRINKDWENELTRHGGKKQVPCLKIIHEDKREEWLYESQEIINYLKNRFPLPRYDK